MKKIAAILIGLFVSAMVISSCKAPERCPAYGAVVETNAPNLG